MKRLSQSQRRWSYVDSHERERSLSQRALLGNGANLRLQSISFLVKTAPPPPESYDLALIFVHSKPKAIYRRNLLQTKFFSMADFTVVTLVADDGGG